MMEEEDEGLELPEGSAAFPEIPAELMINPLLLASLHSLVFLYGSSDEIVNPDAAEIVVGTMVEYLRRLDGPDLRRVKEDMAALQAYGKTAGWPRGEVMLLKELLGELGIGGAD